MNEFYFGILSDEERSRVENLEVFDEHEEFHMKCGHYFLLVAQGGEFLDVIFLNFKNFIFLEFED